MYSCTPLEKPGSFARSPLDISVAQRGLFQNHEATRKHRPARVDGPYLAGTDPQTFSHAASFDF